jgi:hypothetical protein
MQFFLVNSSTDPQITPEVLTNIATACALQLQSDYAPAWQAAGIPVGVAAPDDTNLPQDACVVRIVDDLPDAPQALGYHTIGSSGRPEAFIGWNPIKNNGGTLTTGGLSLSVTISHELLEAARDPYTNWWCDKDPTTEVALEIGDPVEGDSYYTNTPTPVSVSNFVTPRWFSSGAGSYDFMGKLSASFTMSRGGYMILRTGGPNGTTSQVFGDLSPKKNQTALISSRRGTRTA